HLPVHIDELGADLVSVSAHKIGGPKGIGALIARGEVPLEAQITGGAQQGYRRAGTESAALCAGFGAAAARLEQHRNPLRLRRLRERLEQGVTAAVPDTEVLARRAQRLPNTSCIVFEKIEAQSLVVALDLEGIAASYGAACASGMARPSQVLLALGLVEERARSAVRFSLGETTTAEEIEQAIERIVRVVARVREASAARRAAQP
ncbi:MAG: aminotransferase class V-fold PLP-dependent enzyme, partial [Acidobacteriota bacterium]